MTPDVAGRAPVAPLGQDPALNPERLEGGHLLGLGRKPRQAGMLDDVVEREQPTHQHVPGGDLSPPKELPGSERPVDLAGPDPAHAADPVDAAGRGLFDGQALRDERVDGAPHLLGVATQETRPLRAGEDAAVQAGQGDPLGPASGPAEGLQSLLASPEMDDQRGCPWLKNRLRMWAPFLIAACSLRFGIGSARWAASSRARERMSQVVQRRLGRGSTSGNGPSVRVPGARAPVFFSPGHEYERAGG